MDYYESTLRTMRAIKRDLTKEEAWAKIKSECLAASVSAQDSLEETEDYLAYAEKRFTEAWAKTEIVTTKN